MAREEWNQATILRHNHLFSRKPPFRVLTALSAVCSSCGCYQPISSLGAHRVHILSRLSTKGRHVLVGSSRAKVLNRIFKVPLMHWGKGPCEYLLKSVNWQLEYSLEMSSKCLKNVYTLVIHSKDFILKNVTDKYANISTGILIRYQTHCIIAQSVCDSLQLLWIVNYWNGRRIC